MLHPEAHKDIVYNKMFEFLFSWRLQRKRNRQSNCSMPTKAKHVSGEVDLRKKRQSDKADLRIQKKTRRLTNSGFLDRAFENAWFLPEDAFDDDDQTVEEFTVQPHEADERQE